MANTHHGGAEKAETAMYNANRKMQNGKPAARARRIESAH
jgi:hypothetical protein